MLAITLPMTEPTAQPVRWGRSRRRLEVCLFQTARPVLSALTVTTLAPVNVRNAQQEATMRSTAAMIASSVLLDIISLQPILVLQFVCPVQVAHTIPTTRLLTASLFLVVLTPRKAAPSTCSVLKTRIPISLALLLVPRVHSLLVILQQEVDLFRIVKLALPAFMDLLTVVVTLVQLVLSLILWGALTALYALMVQYQLHKMIHALMYRQDSMHLMASLSPVQCTIFLTPMDHLRVPLVRKDYVQIMICTIFTIVTTRTVM
jgi:hypothetical protein